MDQCCINIVQYRYRTAYTDHSKVPCANVQTSLESLWFPVLLECNQNFVECSVNLLPRVVDKFQIYPNVEKAIHRCSKLNADPKIINTTIFVCE